MNELTPNFIEGDVLGATTVNAIIRALLNAGVIDIRGAGVIVREGSRGQFQIAGTPGQPGIPVVVSSGGISARSGSTPGTGNVEIQVLSPATGDLVDSGIQITGVNSFSSTTGGFPSGVYGFVSYDPEGNPWFTSADCGN